MNVTWSNSPSTKGSRSAYPSVNVILPASDGSPVVTTSAPAVDHRFRTRGPAVVRVEATDALGHRAVSAQTLRPGREGN